MPLIRYFLFVGGVLFALLLAASHSGVKKEPPARKRADARPQAKRGTKLARTSADPRLALERHDFFAGGWW